MVVGTGTVVVAADYFQSYSVVGLLTAVGVLFVAVAFGAGRLLRPVVPTPEKLLTYECGVDPVGEGWAHTQVRYYVYAFLYVIFAVDSIFLFPWATVFAAPGYGEMFVDAGYGELVEFARTRPNPKELFDRVPDDLLDHVALVGDEATLRRRIHEYEHAGLAEIALVPAAPELGGIDTLEAIGV